MMKKLLVVLMVLGGALFWWLERPYPHLNIELPPLDMPTLPPTAAPIQQDLPRGADFRVHGHQFKLLAKYSVTAAIIGRERYRMDDGASFAPVDFALGWGRMSDPRVYQALEISQGGRWYVFRYENQPPIPKHEIQVSSANTHIIPANRHVAARLAKLKTHQVVTLKGYLVEVRSAAGITYRSSLSREDTGAGSCEVLLVLEVE
jgi:hypothetical protein